MSETPALNEAQASAGGPAVTPSAEGKPHVLIVGGGLGGLMFAQLLDRAGISYQVFERASKLRSLGKVIAHSLVCELFPLTLCLRSTDP